MLPLLLLFAATLPIREARKAPGPEVTVHGAVTVLPNTFRSATSDAGFAIQDSTGGIYVSTHTIHKLRMLERVRVTGKVQDDGHGQLVLKPSKVEKLKGPIIAIPTRRVAAAEVPDHQGELVTVQGIITRLRPDAPYGLGVFINDGKSEVQVYIHQSTTITTRDFFNIGMRIGVTGFSGQYNPHPEVCPRTAEDIQENPAKN